MNASACPECCHICRGDEDDHDGYPCHAHRPDDWAPLPPLVDPNGLVCCLVCKHPLPEHNENEVVLPVEDEAE